MANIILRIPEDLHRVASIAAAGRRAKVSLNRWILMAIRAAVLREGRLDPSGPVASALGQRTGK